jgi:hypothetical protein
MPEMLREAAMRMDAVLGGQREPSSPDSRPVGCQLGCQIAAREASIIAECAEREARPAGFEPATLGSEVSRATYDGDRR